MSVTRDFFRAFRDQEKPWGWISFEVDEYMVHVLLSAGSSPVHRLNEAKSRGIPLGGKYSAVVHQPHTPKGMKHIEVYARNNKILAMNIDGSAHDAFHGVHIPNRVADALRDKFPEFSLPADNFLEWLSPEQPESGL